MNHEGEWIPDGPLLLLLNGKTIHVASLNGRVVFYEAGNKPAGAVDILIQDMKHD